MPASARGSRNRDRSAQHRLRAECQPARPRRTTPAPSGPMRQSLCRNLVLPTTMAGDRGPRDVSSLPDSGASSRASQTHPCCRTAASMEPASRGAIPARIRAHERDSIACELADPGVSKKRGPSAQQPSRRRRLPSEILRAYVSRGRSSGPGSEQLRSSRSWIQRFSMSQPRTRTFTRDAGMPSLSKMPSAFSAEAGSRQTIERRARWGERSSLFVLEAPCIWVILSSPLGPTVPSPRAPGPLRA